MLKDKHPEFAAHFERAKQFRWRNLIFIASEPVRLREALKASGERLWRLRALDVSLEREPRQGRRVDDPWAMLSKLQLPPMPHDLTEPSLRHAALPLRAIPDCTPLLSHLTVTDILVPSTISDMGTVLRRLQGLPPSLTKLSVKHEGSTSRGDMRTEGIGITASFPNLVELSLDEFEARAMNALLNGLNCPSLRFSECNAL